MINLQWANHNEFWEFVNIKIIRTNEPNLLHKQILESISDNKFVCEIDQKPINATKIIHINEFTKCKDLLNFTKNNPFLKYVSERINFSEMINLENLEKEMDILNEEMCSNFFEFNQDPNKILQTIFSLNTDLFLSPLNFIQFLEINKTNTERLTIFISDVSWFRMEEIKTYLNFYNFIVFTKDFRVVLKNFNVSILDSILVNFNGKTFTDLVDLSVACNYISDHLQTPLEYEELIDFFRSNLGLSKDKIQKITKILEEI